MKYILSIIAILFFTKLSYAFYSTDTKQKDSIHISSKKLLSNNGFSLQNNWNFYWNELLQPGEFSNATPLANVSLIDWTNFKDNNKKPLPSLGFATYRIHFTIDKTNKNIALYVPRIIGSYKLWVNGNLAKQLGKVGKNPSTTLHRRFTEIIPLNNTKTSFEIVIQVANFYNKKGGITSPIYIGKSDNLLRKKALQHTTDMIFIGSLSFVGILFLLFYLFFWDKDKAVLYFSVLCLAMAYHTANDRYAPLAVIFDDLSWIFITKLEYLASHVIGIAGSLFFASIVPKYIHPYYKKAILSSIAVCSVLVIVLPPPYFTYLILPFLILLLINLAYGLTVIFKAIKYKASSSKLLLLSISSAVIIFTLHILFFIYENQMALIFVKYGNTFVFICISLLLMQRFAKSFSALEKSNKLVGVQKQELTEINLMLNNNIQQLENSNAELDDFNHIVSHDLKSPLISVHSLATIIEKDLSNSLHKKTKTHLKYLKDVIEKMDTSINSLLEYSKATKENKLQEKFMLNELLEMISNFFNHQKDNLIKLPKKDIQVFANKIELEHVFQNLISNSIKYNDKEKAIIEISANETIDEYTFSVSDNGPGIPEKHHERIFRIFSQLEENKDDDSTGIGLAIVKKIVSKNKGIINVNSEAGKGLTITFSWKKLQQNKE